MKIINPYTEILTPLDGQAILQHIELCGRVCYKSEDKITDTSAAKFVAGIIKRGHEAVLEHFDITVKFVCDRGVSHEIVRHRMASYCQESTRYCNYSKDKFGNQITCIDLATGFSYDLNDENDRKKYEVWQKAMEAAEQIKDALKKYGYQLSLDTPTNQIFCIVSNEVMKKIAQDVEFGFWEKYDETHSVIRFATSWATREEDVNALCRILRECSAQEKAAS